MIYDYRLLIIIKIMKQTLILILIIFTCKTGFSQSKIGKAEKSIKKEKNSSRSSTNSNAARNKNHNYNNDDDDDAVDTLLLIDSFVGISKIIFNSVYGILIEMPFERRNPDRKAILNKHPYLNSSNGNYSFNWNDNSTVGKTTISSKYIFENTTLDGLHVNADIRFYNKMAIEVDYLQLWENNVNFGNDALAIYNFIVKHHRIRSEKFDAWWGIGASYVDGAVNELGFTYSLGAELFMVKPVSLESNFNQTFINANSIKKFNASLNYYRKQFKFSGGYEHLKIGTQSFSMPSIGLGITF